MKRKASELEAEAKGTAGVPKGMKVMYIPIYVPVGAVAPPGAFEGVPAGGIGAGEGAIGAEEAEEGAPGTGRQARGSEVEEPQPLAWPWEKMPDEVRRKVQARARQRGLPPMQRAPGGAGPVQEAKRRRVVDMEGEENDAARAHAAPLAPTTQPVPATVKKPKRKGRAGGEGDREGEGPRWGLDREAPNGEWRGPAAANGPAAAAAAAADDSDFDPVGPILGMEWAYEALILVARLTVDEKGAELAGEVMGEWDPKKLKAMCRSLPPTRLALLAASWDGHRAAAALSLLSDARLLEASQGPHRDKAVRGQRKAATGEWRGPALAHGPVAAAAAAAAAADDSDSDSDPVAPLLGMDWAHEALSLVDRLTGDEDWVEVAGDVMRNWGPKKLKAMCRSLDLPPARLARLAASWDGHRTAAALSLLPDARLPEACQELEPEELIEIVPCLKPKRANLVLSALYFASEDPHLSRSEVASILAAIPEGPHRDKAVRGLDQEAVAAVLRELAQSDSSCDGDSPVASDEDAGDVDSDDGNEESCAEEEKEEEEIEVMEEEIEVLEEEEVEVLGEEADGNPRQRSPMPDPTGASKPPRGKASGVKAGPSAAAAASAPVAPHTDKESTPIAAPAGKAGQASSAAVCQERHQQMFPTPKAQGPKSKTGGKAVLDQLAQVANKAPTSLALGRLQNPRQHEETRVAQLRTFARARAGPQQLGEDLGLLDSPGAMLAGTGESPESDLRDESIKTVEERQQTAQYPDAIKRALEKDMRILSRSRAARAAAAADAAPEARLNRSRAVTLDVVFALEQAGKIRVRQQGEKGSEGERAEEEEEEEG